MSAFAPLGTPPQTLRALVFGPAAAQTVAFALSFPQPRVITFDPNIRFFGGADADVRVAYPKTVGEIKRLIAAIKSGEETAGTIVFYAFSRVWDAINYGLAHEAKDAFYLRRAQCMAEIVRATEDLPCHVVFLAREKSLYAQPGTIVNGHLVGKDDLITIGGVADIDKNTEYELDLVMRVTHDEAKGVDVARVTQSFRAGLAPGREFPVPQFADLAAAIAGAEPMPSEPATPSAAEDPHDALPLDATTAALDEVAVIAEVPARTVDAAAGAAPGVIAASIETPPVLAAHDAHANSAEGRIESLRALFARVIEARAARVDLATDDPKFASLGAFLQHVGVLDGTSTRLSAAKRPLARRALEGELARACARRPTRLAPPAHLQASA